MLDDTFNWKSTSLMLFVHVGAVVGLFFFSWTALCVMLILHVLIIVIGIFMGYHRYFSHRSFSAPRWLESFLAIAGSLAMQGSPKAWACAHYIHHQHSDTHKDLHSPTKSFLWSHVLWMMFENRDPDFQQSFQKLNRRFEERFGSNPVVGWMERPLVYLGMQAILFLLLYIIGGVEVALWGGFVRLVMGYHTLWGANSIAHLYGPRSYNTPDNSRNNWFVGFFSLGEWHNNHHAFPACARSGFGSFQFDLPWIIIRTLAQLGLVSEVRLPSAEQLSQEQLPKG